MQRYVLYCFIALAVFAAPACVRYAPEESVVGDYLGGRYAARNRDVGAAAQSFRATLVEAPGSTDILRDAFFYSLASGDVVGAGALAGKLSERAGADAEGLPEMVLAAIALTEGRYGDARRVIEAAEPEPYLQSTFRILRAWAAVGEGGADAGAKILVEADPDEFRGFYPLQEAFLAEKAGRDGDARTAYQIAIATYGGQVGRLAYGAYLERSGDVDAARAYYDVLSAGGGAGRHMAADGVARLDKETPSDAYADVSPPVGAAIAFHSLGAAMLDRTVSQRAAAERAGYRVGLANYNMPLVFFQLARFLDPSLDEARRIIGSLYNVYGEHEKAVAILRTIPASSPYYEEARIDMARAFSAQDQDKKAISVLRGAIRKLDRAEDALFALSGLYADLGRNEEAVKTLARLIDALPEAPGGGAWRYFMSRGAALHELGRWPDAETDLKRAVELGPEEPMALNYLGYSWAERGENLEEAFVLIEKAVALEPDSGAIIDSLGWAHYQLGAYEEALGHLEQAASLEPGDPTITDHLGDVYWRLGRKTEARYQWRHALDLDPGDEQIVSIKNKLENGLGADPMEEAVP